MEALVYREARPQDGGGITALLKEIMAQHAVQPPPDDELLRTVDSILASSNHTFFVAAGPHGLLGLCALLFSLSSWRGVLVCELQDVVVTEAARSRNIGRTLVESALELARQRGCAWAYLTTESWNLEAHSFYRRLGFEEKTVLYFEKGLDVS